MYVNTLEQAPPTRQNHINLETIPPPLPTKSNYVSSQLIQEILKTCGETSHIKQEVKQLVYN